MSKVLKMGRRRSPSDPGARGVLVELAQDTREKIRECRLAMEYYASVYGPAAAAPSVRDLRRKIAELRRNYRSGRETIETAEAMQGPECAQGRVLAKYGINPSSKGIPPEEWLNHRGYMAVMARRERLSGTAGRKSG